MKNKLILFIGFFVTALGMVTSVAAIPIVAILDKRFSSSNVGIYLFFTICVASIVLILLGWSILKKVEVMVDEFQCSFNSYGDFEQFIEASLKNNLYKLHSKTVISENVTLSAYVSEIASDKICCFALCRGTQIGENEFKQSNNLLFDILRDYNTGSRFFGANELKSFHCIIIYLPETPNDYIEKIKSTPMYSFSRLDFGEIGQRTWLFKKCGILYACAPLYDIKLFVPKLHILSPASNKIRKIYVKELCKVLNLQKPLNSEGKKKK